jgi:transcriptional regulator with XRE-family HTH domain
MLDGVTEDGAEAAGLFPSSVGQRLHAARVEAGLDLNDIAAKTRVPMRHLEAIERSEYASLPSSTYALGFARQYARAVGLNEVDLARDLRAELGRAPLEVNEAMPYEPLDPSRVPSRLLAWTAAAIAVVLLICYFVLKNMAFGDVAPPVGETAQPSVVATAPAAVPPAVPPAATGQVVLTAMAPAWVRVYDRADKVLFEKEMAVGESWPVPVEADTPMIRTGRADALKVTIDGKEVAPLGPAERTVRDVLLTAAALAARPALAPSLPPAESPAAKTEAPPLNAAAASAN